MGYVEEEAEEACILVSLTKVSRLTAGENDEEEEEEVLTTAKWCSSSCKRSSEDASALPPRVYFA